MQKGTESLDIDGHAIYPGCRVTVRWRGVWYDGTVIRLGPQRNLFKVCDLNTSKMLLADRQQLKFRESQLLGRQLSPGTLVMYNDGESWREGSVESCNATGAALVRWRTPLAGKNESWFELGDIGPVIRNEAYHGYDKYLLEASKSELQLEDVITQKPRTVHNLLYQSDSEHSENESPTTSRSKKFKDKKMTTSPTYESIGSDTVNPYNRPLPQPPPSRKLTQSTPHPGIARPHAMGRPARASSSRSHQRPIMGGLRTTLEQTSLPCAYSYINNVRGIPPHNSSIFFQQLHMYRQFPGARSKALCFLPTRYGTRSDEPQARSVSTIKPSPTWLPEPHSDPTPYAEQFFVPSHFRTHEANPHRKAGGKTPSARNATRSVKSHSRSPQHKKAVPLPYEVPQRLRHAGVDLKKQAYSSRAQHIQQHAKGEQSDRVDYAQIDFSQQYRNKQVAPTVTSASPSHIHVAAGSSTLLTCIASNNGPVTYHWLKKGKDISKHDSHITQPAPGMLRIQEASQKDGGYYSCIISNQYGSETKVFHLEIVPDPLYAADSKVSTGASHLPKSTFTNEVTYQELSFDLPDTHSSDQPNCVSHTTQRKYDAKEEGKIISTERVDPTEETVEGSKKTDAVATFPQLMTTSERKMDKRNRNRISSVLKNDIDQYLEGYGEDYGAISSATDLEQEGLQQFAPVDVVKNIDKMAARNIAEENKRKLARSAQTKVDSEAETPSTRNRRRLLRLRKLPKTPKFLKKSKKGIETADVLHRGIDGVQMTSRIRDIPEPGKPLEGWREESEIPVAQKSNSGSPDIDQNKKVDVTCVAVNTSNGSSDTELSVHSVESGVVSLPLETESVNNQVKRLQLSVQACRPENFGSASKMKRKGFISSIFTSKNKVVTATA